MQRENMRQKHEAQLKNRMGIRREGKGSHQSCLLVVQFVMKAKEGEEEINFNVVLSLQPSFVKETFEETKSQANRCGQLFERKRDG